MNVMGLLMNLAFLFAAVALFGMAGAFAWMAWRLGQRPRESVRTIYMGERFGGRYGLPH